MSKVRQSGVYVLPKPIEEPLPSSIEDVVCKHCNDPEHKFRLIQKFQFNSVVHYAVYEDGMTVWLSDGQYTTRPDK